MHSSINVKACGTLVTTELLVVEKYTKPYTPSLPVGSLVA